MGLRSDAKIARTNKPENIMKSIPKSNIEKERNNIARTSERCYANDRENFMKETKRQQQQGDMREERVREKKK
jgi:hypothetical protein